MYASDWQAVGPHASSCLMVLSQHQVVSKLGTTPRRGTGSILEMALLFFPAGWPEGSLMTSHQCKGFCEV